MRMVEYGVALEQLQKEWPPSISTNMHIYCILFKLFYSKANKNMNINTLVEFPQLRLSRNLLLEKINCTTLLEMQQL